MIAPVAHRFLRALAQSPSVHSIILAIDALYDALFSISDHHHTIPAYVALLLHTFTINAFDRVTQRLTLNSLPPDISQALVLLAASILTVPPSIWQSCILLSVLPHVPV